MQPPNTELNQTGKRIPPPKPSGSRSRRRRLSLSPQLSQGPSSPSAGSPFPTPKAWRFRWDTDVPQQSLARGAPDCTCEAVTSPESAGLHRGRARVSPRPGWEHAGGKMERGVRWGWRGCSFTYLWVHQRNGVPGKSGRSLQTSQGQGWGRRRVQMRGVRPRKEILEANANAVRPEFTVCRPRWF